jgi:RNA polymerase sigma-70 factor (ECF subfamily)
MAKFEEVVQPHLSAAYNLARWLLRNDRDAEDMVQEACVRALHGMRGFQGEDGRSWTLTIVRNLCYTFLKKRGSVDNVEFNEHVHVTAPAFVDPERLQMRLDDERQVRGALEQLPDVFREVLVLREMEGLSYREIARIIGVPTGTVMSRLARGRERLLAILKGENS